MILKVQRPFLSSLNGLNQMTKKPKRPRDVTGNAVHVMKILTGEIEEELPVEKEKNAAAVAMGRKGGNARASKLSAKERSEIAKKAAAKRWNTKK